MYTRYHYIHIYLNLHVCTYIYIYIMYVYVPLVCDVLLKDGMFCADLNASFVQIQIPSGLAHV